MSLVEKRQSELDNRNEGLKQIFERLQSAISPKDENAKTRTDEKIAKLQWRIGELQSQILPPQNTGANPHSNHIGLYTAQIDVLKADITTLQLEKCDQKRKREKAMLINKTSKGKEKVSTQKSVNQQVRDEPGPPPKRSTS
jgi:chromosome segregation ATPase